MPCLECRGTASTLDQAIAGRVVAGLGGAGMIALVSVIITGTPPSTPWQDNQLTLPLHPCRDCVAWPGSCIAKLCQCSRSAGQGRRSSTGRITCRYHRVEMVS